MKTRTRTVAKLYIPSAIQNQINFVLFMFGGRLSHKGSTIIKLSAIFLKYFTGVL